MEQGPFLHGEETSKAVEPSRRWRHFYIRRNERVPLFRSRYCRKGNGLRTASAPPLRSLLRRSSWSSSNILLSRSYWGVFYNAYLAGFVKRTLVAFISQRQSSAFRCEHLLLSGLRLHSVRIYGLLGVRRMRVRMGPLGESRHAVHMMNEQRRGPLGCSFFQASRRSSSTSSLRKRKI